MQIYLCFAVSVLVVADGGVVDTIFSISLHTEDNRQQLFKDVTLCHFQLIFCCDRLFDTRVHFWCI